MSLASLLIRRKETRVGLTILRLLVTQSETPTSRPKVAEKRARTTKFCDLFLSTTGQGFCRPFTHFSTQAFKREVLGIIGEKEFREGLVRQSFSLCLIQTPPYGAITSQHPAYRQKKFLSHIYLFDEKLSHFHVIIEC